VDKAPVFVLVTRDRTLTNTGIQFDGLPSGHDFAKLIQDIALVSSWDSGLKKTARQLLKGLQKTLQLHDFVTLT
jgi:alkyl hydroperoxide reductase subunit AhpF